MSLEKYCVEYEGAEYYRRRAQKSRAEVTLRATASARWPLTRLDVEAFDDAHVAYLQTVKGQW
jgi:hypothetical protein